MAEIRIDIAEKWSIGAAVKHRQSPVALVDIAGAIDRQRADEDGRSRRSFPTRSSNLIKENGLSQLNVTLPSNGTKFLLQLRQPETVHWVSCR